MTPLCSSVTGQLVGWATGVADCDGDLSFEYFNTSGVSQGGTLPANWTVCRANYASDMVQVIQVLTQAEYDALGTYDPNTLYVIIG